MPDCTREPIVAGVLSDASALAGAATAINAVDVAKATNDFIPTLFSIIAVNHCKITDD